MKKLFLMNLLLIFIGTSCNNYSDLNKYCGATILDEDYETNFFGRTSFYLHVKNPSGPGIITLKVKRQDALYYSPGLGRRIDCNLETSFTYSSELNNHCGRVVASKICHYSAESINSDEYYFYLKNKAELIAVPVNYGEYNIYEPGDTIKCE